MTLPPIDRVSCDVAVDRSLTFVEVRVRVTEASALREPDNGLQVGTLVVERGVLSHQPDRMVGRQAFGCTKAVVFRLLDHTGVVALFAASVVVDPVLRTIADVRARVIRRYNVELGKTVDGFNYDRINDFVLVGER